MTVTLNGREVRVLGMVSKPDARISVENPIDLSREYCNESELQGLVYKDGEIDVEASNKSDSPKTSKKDAKPVK